MTTIPTTTTTANITGMTTTTLHFKKWHLAANGHITAWVPHMQHLSTAFQDLKSCYTGRTHSAHMYDVENGQSVVVGNLMIEYEYTVPLTQIKQREVKWKWQGLYANTYTYIIEFNYETHRQEQENAPMHEQTLLDINEIILKLNTPPKEKYQPHNFRLSEGIVLCQHCGEFLAALRKEKTDKLPSCLGNNNL
jgi:hypothetical protein